MILFPLILVLFFTVVVPLVLVSFYFFSFYIELQGAPFVPTTQRTLREVLGAADLKKGQLFFELGSGDGRVVRTAVRLYKVRGVGVEMHPMLVWFARLRARMQKLEKIEFRRQNFFKTDLRGADVIFLFLLPGAIKKLKLKIADECKKGTLIISHGFTIPGWEKRLFKKQERFRFTTYFYRLK